MKAGNGNGILGPCDVMHELIHSLPEEFDSYKWGRASLAELEASNPSDLQEVFVCKWIREAPDNIVFHGLRELLLIDRRLQRVFILDTGFNALDVEKDFDLTTYSKGLVHYWTMNGRSKQFQEVERLMEEVFRQPLRGADPEKMLISKRGERLFSFSFLEEAMDFCRAADLLEPTDSACEFRPTGIERKCSCHE